MTPPTNVKLLEPIEAEYIESGTFVASEECTYEYGVKPGDKVCVITPNVWATLHAQLEAAKGAVEALKFYSSKLNYTTRSTGFAAQYDPETPEICNDNGSRARLALSAYASAAAGGKSIDGETNKQTTR